ncbi:MAG: aldose 1-epimerase family protein, partial [Clostridia bacterium]|nr:aldose 1-epimerase family protein [Clostridia bacterium]
MSIIKSDTLRVEINETGSTLESFYDLKEKEELLWQGSEDSWTGKDVTIFPFVGRLKDGYYTVNGEKYSM